MQKPPERLLRYLDEAHAAEAGLVELLQGCLNDVRNEAVHAALEQQLLQTKDQALRLEARIRALGSQPSPTTSFLGGMLGKVGDLVHAAHDGYDKATQDVIKAYSLQYSLVGTYAALTTFARLLGDSETETLTSQLLREEEEIANRLRPFIDTCSADAFTAASK